MVFVFLIVVSRRKRKKEKAKTWNPEGYQPSKKVRKEPIGQDFNLKVKIIIINRTNLSLENPVIDNLNICYFLSDNE